MDTATGAGLRQIPNQDEPATASIVLENSSATLGDTVNVHGDIVLVPQQNLNVLSSAAKQVLNDGANSGIQDDTNKKRADETPKVLQRGGDWSPRCTRRTSVWTVAFLLAAVTVIGSTVYYFTEPEYGKFVSKKEWNAIPVKADCSISLYPVEPTLVIIHHTDTEPCKDAYTCIEKVRYMQQDHMMTNHWCDIGYNFMVGGDGRIYEGRGFEVVGAHTAPYNSLSMGLGFIGSFVNEHPSEAQLDAAKAFIEDAAEQGHLRDDFKVAGACQVSVKLSPGAQLLSDIKTWTDRFTKDPNKWLEGKVDNPPVKVACSQTNGKKTRSRDSLWTYSLNRKTHCKVKQSG